MARFCTLCGKDSIAGFNPQSVGMNRVRAHRRFRANLQPTVIAVGTTTKRVLVCTRCRRTASKGAYADRDPSGSPTPGSHEQPHPSR
jgi:ribosomal protein L28